MTVSRHLKARSLATTSALAILLSSVGPQVASAAQQAAQEPAALDEIVVTGSRVVRDGYEQPTPVSVMSSDELNAMATNNIADAVNALPAFANSVTPRTSTANLSSGAAGVSQLNLRGIGTNRTLILLDGRRVINSSLTADNSAPDINSFPQALVERVDVVTGGASAAYGSDALTGVVNFVIDRDFTGIKGEVQGGMTKYRDDKNYNLSLAYGTPYAGGRGHFMIAGEIGHNDGISGLPRPWNDLNAAFMVNPAWHPTTNPSVPQYIVGRGFGLYLATPGGLISSGPLKGTYFGPGGTVECCFRFGTASPVQTNNIMLGGDWQYSRIDNGLDMSTRVDRYVSYLRTDFDLTDSITIYADTQWGNAHAVNNSNPNRRLGNNTIRRDNAFLPASIGAQMDALGITTFGMGSTHVDMHRFRSDNRRTIRTWSVGADGATEVGGNEWTWNAYYQYSMTGLSPRTRFNGHTANYLRALDSVIFNGAPTCRVNADAVTTNDDPLCVPYNPFGIGVNDSKTIGYVTGTSYRYESLRQKVAAFSVNGEPFELWAGPVSLAFGGEHRSESVRGIVTAADAITSYFAGNYKVTNGKYSVTEGFIETVIPLARDAAWAQSAELNGAVRATDYSTSGYVTTWKIGGTWQPVDDIRFRATVSRDIRAPNLGELFAGGQANSGNPLFDPLLNINIPASFRLTSGNPNLQPEKADTLGLGAVFTPTFLPGFAFSIDYYNIDIKDAVRAPQAQTIVDLCYTTRPDLCSRVQRSAPIAPATTGLIHTVVTQPENLIGQQAEGMDFEASYRFPLADIVEDWDGDFSIRALATRVITLNTENTDGYVIDGVGAVGEFGGNDYINGLNAPKFRGSLAFAYEGDPITARATVRYVGAGHYGNNYVLCETGCPASTLQRPTLDTSDSRISSMTTLDLAFTYKPPVLEGVETFLTIENALNAYPPVIGGSLGAVHYNGMSNKDYDIHGRQYRAGIRFQF
jgi:outer membrane receptor protein involved in Fe transport